MPTRVILAAMLLLLVAPTATPQDDEFNDDVRGLLQEGIDLYQQGKYQESYERFEKALQMKPESDVVYAFIKRAGEDLVAGMMNAPDEKIKFMGHRLFALAKPGTPIREGKQIVLKYIADLDSDEHSIFLNARFHLKNYGAWAARFLVPILADQQQDRMRSRVILLLTEMGSDVTLALVEALESKDPFLRQQALIVLGNIKDDRAVPAVKRIYEDPNQPPEVRKFAREALSKITRTLEESFWSPATDYYYRLAEKYYYSHSSVLRAWERYYLIWKWDPENDRLTERRVARFAYNEQLAEEALFDLLELDPNYVYPATGESAWSLLAMVHFQQALEAYAGIEAALQSLANGVIAEEHLINMIAELEGYSRDKIESLAGEISSAGDIRDKEQVLHTYLQAQAKVIRANVLARIPGKKYIYEALARSIKDGNHLVATACIDTLKYMGRPGDLPGVPEAAGNGDGQQPPAAAPASALGYPLIEALTNEDKRVRYAAAEAMAAINPPVRKLGMELVIPNLIDAVGEQGVRVALVIYDVQDENDRNFIHNFKKKLLKLNIFPVIARSANEGMIKAKTFPTEDVIIIQRKLAANIYFREDHVREPKLETVFDALADDVRTKHTYRVLLCTDEAEITEAKTTYETTAHGFITGDTHELDMNALLDQLFDTPSAKKDAKDRADEIARRAAETFASIDPTNTLYPFRDAVEPLIRTVSTEILRKDFIRIPAARALGRYGDQRALDVLAKVLDHKEDGHEAEQKPLRLECGRALSEILRQTGVAPAEEVYDVLKKYTKDGDYDIEVVVGEALGNAMLSNEQRLELEKFRRLERDTYTDEDP